MPTVASTPAPARPGSDDDPGLERHRAELRSHCRRILGSSFEADDAVQETLVRAWRAIDGFDGRSSLRTWVHRIATNVCLGMMQQPQRRARPLGVPTDAHAGSADDRDPADVAAEREAVRRAFVVTLSRLPPRQRTVLVLRDVLGWRAAEVAELLDTSVAAANSALQRARSALGADLEPGPGRAAAGAVQPELLSCCLLAFERRDSIVLASLLHRDSRTSCGSPHAGPAPGRDRLPVAPGQTSDSSADSTASVISPSTAAALP